MPKRPLIFLTMLFIVLNAVAQPTTSNFTPDSAVTTALAGNRDLAAARFAIGQAEARLRQAGLMSNPELEVRHATDLLFGNEGEYNFSIGFKQRYPLTGRLEKEKAVARVDIAMAIAEVRNQERLLAGEVLGRSRELLVLREKLGANRDIQTVLQQLLDVSANRLKAAEVSSADVNLARLALQSVSLENAVLLNQQEVAATALNGFLGREPQAPLQMSGDISPKFDSEAASKISGEATARRPDRQLAALGIDRAGAEIILARAGKWEDVTVGIELSRDFSRFGPPIGGKLDNKIGLSVSIPLPWRNNNQGRISEAQMTRQRAEAELRALELHIATEAQTAENQMRRLFELLRQYREDTLKLAEENIALLQKGYAGGLVGIAPVIQAQQQYSELRQGYLNVLTDFVRARTEWETATATIPLNPTRN